MDAILAVRPQGRLIDHLRATGIETTLTEEEVNAAEFLDIDLERLIADTNEEIVAAELSSRRSFFDTIEKSPLTDEQARAVVCFDNRVQVLAAAGSGKTSVMVARAAYAVSRGFVAPDRILLLAFNKAAAAELQERVEARFAAAGIDSSGLRASTFHSFGLEVIGRATGEKPRLAPWLDQGGDVGMVLRIVDELRDASESFRYRWDLYRLLFAERPDRPRPRTSRTATITRPEDRLPDVRRRGGQEPRRTDDRQFPVPQRGRLRLRTALRRRCRGRHPFAVPPRLLLPRHRRLARALGARPGRQASRCVRGLRRGHGMEAPGARPARDDARRVHVGGGHVR